MQARSGRVEAAVVHDRRAREQRAESRLVGRHVHEAAPDEFVPHVVERGIDGGIGGGRRRQKTRFPGYQRALVRRLSARPAPPGKPGGLSQPLYKPARLIYNESPGIIDDTIKPTSLNGDPMFVITADQRASRTHRDLVPAALADVERLVGDRLAAAAERTVGDEIQLATTTRWPPSRSRCISCAKRNGASGSGVGAVEEPLPRAGARRPGRGIPACAHRRRARQEVPGARRRRERRRAGGRRRGSSHPPAHRAARPPDPAGVGSRRPARPRG